MVGGLLDLIGGLFAWFLLPFFLFYLLKDQPKMASTLYSRVPAPWKDDVDRMLTISVGNFAQYFKAEFLVGSIMFVLVTVGMLVIGYVTDSPLLIEFAILLGLAAFVFELIPQIGPILAYIPALILALGSSPEAVVLVSVFYFIAFNIEGSILVPTFEGRIDLILRRVGARAHRDRVRDRGHPRSHPRAAARVDHPGPVPSLLRQGRRRGPGP